MSARHLDGMPMLLTEPGCRYRGVLEKALGDVGAHVDIVGEFTSSETIKRCVEAGSGLGVLAAVSVAAEIADGTLVALPWEGPDLRIRTYLAWDTRRSISPAMKAVIHTARVTLA